MIFITGLSAGTVSSAREASMELASSNPSYSSFRKPGLGTYMTGSSGEERSLQTPAASSPVISGTHPLTTKTALGEYSFFARRTAFLIWDSPP